MLSFIQILKKDKFKINEVEQRSLQVSCQDNFITFCLMKYWGGVKDNLY